MPREPLTPHNSAIHDRLEDSLLGFYEALTALDLADARARWSAWQDEFGRHLDLEEAELMPALERLVPAHLPAGDVLYKQVDGDHTVLARTIGRVEDALTALEQRGPDRRALVRELDTFLLLRRVLEHHTLRETRHAYPLLDEHLEDDAHARLLAALRDQAPV